jgi:excisionase family DNA binding protein
MDTAEPSVLLTVNEVAGRLRMSPQQVRRYIDAGRLAAIRPGGRGAGGRRGGELRIPSSALDELLEPPADREAASST